MQRMPTAVGKVDEPASISSLHGDALRSPSTSSSTPEQDQDNEIELPDHDLDLDLDGSQQHRDQQQEQLPTQPQKRKGGRKPVRVELCKFHICARFLLKKA
jgi:hypothetical protein